MGNDQSRTGFERRRQPYSFTPDNLSIPRQTSSIYPNLHNNGLQENTYFMQQATTSSRSTNNYQLNQSAVNLQQCSSVQETFGGMQPQPSAPPQNMSTLNSQELPVTGRSGPFPKKRHNGISCKTCRCPFGLNIFQCSNGHSSCETCKNKKVNCGICHSLITDIRNFALQDCISEQMPMPCPNKSEGCIYQFPMSKMASHEKECLFKELECPVGAVIGQCCWKGKLSQIKYHFDDQHPETRGDVGEEMILPNIYRDDRLIHMTQLGSYNFLVHIKISEAERKMFVTVQLLGAKTEASKWSYELHIYNKREPRRKFHFTDYCHSLNMNVDRLFQEAQCAVIPLHYAMTYMSEGSLTYKFFIKKMFEAKPQGRPEFGNRNGPGRGQRIK